MRRDGGFSTAKLVIAFGGSALRPVSCFRGVLTEAWVVSDAALVVMRACFDVCRIIDVIGRLAGRGFSR